MMEIFTIMSNELKGRLDPYFYKPEFKELEDKLRNSKWEIRKFGEVIETIYRYPTFFGIEYLENGKIPVIKGENINKFGVIEKNQDFDFIDEETHKNFYQTEILENDLIFSVRGIVGKVGIFENQLFPKANINANVIKIRIKNSLPKFIWILLNSSFAQKTINKILSGQVQPTITVPDIKSLKIPIPPLKIQNEIISIMDGAYETKKHNGEKAKNLIDSIDNFVLKKLGVEIPELKNETCFVINSEELENSRFDAEFHRKKYKQIEQALKNGKYELKEIGELIKYVKKGVEVGSNEYSENGKIFLRVADFDNFGIYGDGFKRISNKTFEENKNFRPQKDEILFSKDGTIGFFLRFGRRFKRDYFKRNYKDKTQRKHGQLFFKLPDGEQIRKNVI